MSNNSEHIDRLIVRYLSGEATPEEAMQLEQWMDESPENKKYFGDIRFVHEKTVTSHKYIKVNTEKAWEKVAGQMKKPSVTLSEPTPARSISLKWIRYAASIAFLVAVSAIILFTLYNKPGYKTEFASTNSIISRTLEGSTQVVLNKNSKITYKTQKSGRKKEITLTGEAFIKVQHSGDTTLLVQAGETFIRDIGTSFNVKAYPESNTVEVFVESGEVAFYTNESEGISLKMNETGIYNKSLKQFSKKTRENPNVISYKTKIFVFRNTRLIDALKELNDVYPEKITLANNNLENCPINVTFDNESVYTIASIIAETLGLEKTEKEGVIVLSGDSCQSH